MQITLDYGRGKLSVDLPDDCDVTVVEKTPIPVLDAPEAAVRAALAEPDGSAPLATVARGKRSACILICDITRPVPNGLLLRPLIETLMASGMAADAITVLVATGLHRPNEGDELAQLIGDSWVLEHVRVENHFARDHDAHVDLGRTPGRGVPVKLDRRFVEAELKLVTGLVEPHFMAGYSGGRKVIAPGIAHEDTIRTFHNAAFMGHAKATQCVLDGNPLHEEQLAIVRMVGEVFAVNTVIDEHRRLSFVNFGEIVASHGAAVAFAHEATRVPVARQFHTVLTSAAGYPLDRTYYQTVKGMVTPMAILADGADLIVASDCSEGLGSPEYRTSQARLLQLGTDGFLAEIGARAFAEVDEWQTQMQLRPMRAADVSLYSEGLPAADRPLTGVRMIERISEAVEASFARSGERSIAVIPEGPYVVPYLEHNQVVAQ
ncbi:MAG: nickel-dependent lactate racemase [Pseudomonadota bacterium]